MSLLLELKGCMLPSWSPLLGTEALEESYCCIQERGRATVSYWRVGCGIHLWFVSQIFSFSFAMRCIWYNATFKSMVGKYLSCEMRDAGDVANRRGVLEHEIFLMSNTSDKFLCYAVWYCSPSPCWWA